MLKSLRIKDLALIRSTHLEFGSGLSVLTGESGSGKSILLDALALVTGGARPRLRVTSGRSSGFVEAEFRPLFGNDGQLTSTELKLSLDEHGLLEACSSPDEPLILARRIDASGRTRCFIQGQTVSRAVLASVGGHLLELCGQSEAHNLRTPAAQLMALDRFAKLGVQQRKLHQLVKHFKAQEGRVSELELAAAEAERRRDFVEFQLQELDEVDLTALSERRARLDCLSEATSNLACHEELLDCLKSSDQAIIPRLRWISARLGYQSSNDSSGVISAAIARLDSATLEFEGLARSSTSIVADLDRSREEAERLRDDLSSLDSLARKHRVSVDELSLRQKELREELESTSRLGDELKAAHLEAKSAFQAAQVAAENLHDLRLAAARLLDKKMKKELARVGLPGARFETQLRRAELSWNGMSELDFLFSANPGHEMAPLSRVASGGELSRVLLCFRLATESSGVLLVFDEIDAGAGGKTAEKIAQALERAGRTGQVLCVTHWPQVAGAAAHQFSVSKHIADGETYSEVHLVAGQERLHEISRMLGGAETTALEHASGMIRDTTQAA